MKTSQQHEYMSKHELEQEIDQTRGRLESTIHEIERRLEPEQMVRQFIGPLREGGGDFTRNLTNSLRNNPLPAIVTAVGIAWMMTGRGPSTRDLRSSGESFEGGSVRYRGSGSLSPRDYDDGGSSPSMLDGVKQSLSEAGDKVKSLVDQGKSKVAGARDSAGNLVDSSSASARKFGDRFSQSTDQMRDELHARGVQTRIGMSRASEQVQRMYREQPLALGAIGLAVGAFLGALVPPTRQEDRLIGPHRDKLADAAKDEAANQYETAKDAAAQKIDEATKGAKEAIHQSEGNKTDSTKSDSSRSDSSRSDSSSL